MSNENEKAKGLKDNEVGQSAVEGFVMPVRLEEGQLLNGTIYLSMLREDLAHKHFDMTLKQLADNGGVTPSQAIAIKDHLWAPVDNKTGLKILNHCFEGGWA